jgi:hypothetical protein
VLEAYKKSRLAVQCSAVQCLGKHLAMQISVNMPMIMIVMKLQEMASSWV